MSESSRQLAAIMFTDIVGYTSLMGKDSSKAMDLVRKSVVIQKPLVEKHNGQWIKEMGDGTLVRFSTALDAVNCALEIQRASRADFEADLRIGIHLGDITVENGDVYGDGVNVASRLESAADPGGIYISESVEKSIRGQTEVQAKYLGEIRLKNVDYGVRTYALQGVGLPIPQIKDEKQLSGHFTAELSRRGVYRTTIAYLGLGFLLYAALPVISSVISLPSWTIPVVTALLLIGLPVSIYLSWTYEWSPTGFVRTTSEMSWQNPYTVIKRKPLTSNYVIGIIWIAALALIFYPDTTSLSNSNSIPQDKSIAVLAFADLSPEGDQEYFSDGISEEIINALVQIPGLKVAGRTSSFSFKGKDETAQVMGQQLGVNTLLEGSVRKSGNQLRVTAQLINTFDGFHIWSQTYQREMTDVFKIQDEITASIVDALQVQLRPGSSDLPETSQTDLNAYELYLRARQALAARGVDLYDARRLFEQVIEIDPDYSPAYSGLARTLSMLPAWEYTPVLDVLPDAYSAANKALEIDNENAEAYSVLGYLQGLHDWNWEQAGKNIQRSAELKPRDTEIINFLGDYYATIDHPDLVATEKLALDLDPLHPVKHSDLAIAYLHIGNWNKAAEYAANTMRMDSSLTFGANTWVLALLEGGKLDEAQHVIERVEDWMQKSDIPWGNNEWHLAEMKAYLDLARDREKSAIEQIQKLVTASEKGEFSFTRVAALYIRMADWQKAATYLVKAFDAKEAYPVSNPTMILIPFEQTNNPILQSVMDRPGLVELLAIRRNNQQLAKR